MNWTLTCITKIDTRHQCNEHRVFFWHKWRQSDVTGARTSGVCLSLAFLLTFQWAMMRRFERVLVITVNKQTTVHHQFLVFERASFRPRLQRAVYYILSVHLYSMCLYPPLTHVCARPGSASHSWHRYQRRYSTAISAAADHMVPRTRSLTTYLPKRGATQINLPYLSTLHANKSYTKAWMR